MMLSAESEQIIAQIFVRLIKGEKQIEALRVALSQTLEFNASALYSSLTKDSGNTLSASDLQSYLLGQSLNYSEDQIFLVFRQYSALQNGCLTLEDFTHLVLPSTKDYLSNLSLSIPYLKISAKSISNFLSLIKSELELQIQLEGLKVTLFKNPNFTLWKAFEVINASGSGRISEDEVQKFLRKSGEVVREDDYDALMRRIDIEDDLEVSYNEFLDALVPLKIPANTETRVRKAEEEKEEVFETAEDVPVKENRKNLDEGAVNDMYKTPETRKNRGNHEFYQNIREIFVKMLESGRKINFYKENLVMLTNFSVVQAFKIFDADNKDEICLFDFEKILDEWGIEYRRDSLWRLFELYSARASLNLEDFTRIFECSEEYGELLQIEGETPLNQVTADALKEFIMVLVTEEASLYRNVEESKDLTDDELISYFSIIDVDQDGTATIGDLQESYKAFGINARILDCLNIIKRFAPENDSFAYPEFNAYFSVKSED